MTFHVLLQKFKYWWRWRGMPKDGYVVPDGFCKGYTYRRHVWGWSLVPPKFPTEDAK